MKRSLELKSAAEDAYKQLLDQLQEDTEKQYKEAGMFAPAFLALQVRRAFEWRMEQIYSIVGVIAAAIDDWELGWIPPVDPLSGESALRGQLRKAEDPPLDDHWDDLTAFQKQTYQQNLSRWLSRGSLIKEVEEALGPEQAKEYYDKIISTTALGTAEHLMHALNGDKDSRTIGSGWGKYTTEFLSRAQSQAIKQTQLMRLGDTDTAINAIMSGLKSGEGVHRTIHELRNNKDFTASRAKSFAITEVEGAYSGGQFVALMQNKNVGYKQWSHSGGYRNQPREAHVAIDGTIIPKADKFRVNGYDADYPRDPALPPSERINCHCSLTPALAPEGEDDGWDDLDEALNEAREEIDYKWSDPEWAEARKAEIFNRSRYAENHPGAQYGTAAPAVRTPTATVPWSAEDNDAFKTEQVGGKTYYKAADEDKAERAYDAATDKQLDNLIADLGNSGEDRLNDAVVVYTTSSYQNINQYMRGSIDELSNESASTVRTLMDAMDKSKLTQNTILYRGDTRQIDYTAGDTITTSGFWSASMSAETGSEFAMDESSSATVTTLYKIYLPQGQAAIPIAPYSAYSAELEMLLPPGQQYRVVSVSEPKELHMDGNHTNHFYREVAIEPI
jgi:uncharacterized protein with gpF-like domain